MIGTTDIGMIKTRIVLGFIEPTVLQRMENYNGKWINGCNSLLKWAEREEKVVREVRERTFESETSKLKRAESLE